MRSPGKGGEEGDRGLQLRTRQRNTEREEECQDTAQRQGSGKVGVANRDGGVASRQASEDSGRF